MHGTVVDSSYRRDLLLSAATALATVGLLRLDFAAAAAFAALLLLLSRTGPVGAVGLVALPVLFASLPAPAPMALLPGPGPVRVEGRVLGARRDLAADEQRIRLDTANGQLDLDCPASVAALPGDGLRAVARCSEPALLGGRPSLHAAESACATEIGPTSLPRVCAQLRLALERAMLRIAPPEHASLLSTLVLGRGPRLPEEVASAHRATGLSHLLAVSGAHAAMLAWLLGLQPFGGGRRRPVSRTHLVVAMGLLLVYGAVTGLEPPMFRALLGYLLVAVGLRLGRRVTAWQALLWPALVSAIAAPDGVLGPSFGLSYAAVAGLSLAGPPRSHSRLERFVLAPVRASTWAAIATAPLTLFWFGQFAPWTVALTPLLAPFVFALLLLGLLCAVAEALGLPFADAGREPLRILADLYTESLVLADGLPGTPVHAIANPNLPMLAAGAALGLAALLVLRSRRGTAIGCALCALPHFVAPPPAPAALHLFAVGHGQAALAVLDDGRSVLVDCGSQPHPLLPARLVERTLARRRIDWLVLTHADSDHTSAVPDLLSRLEVVHALLPESMRGDAVTVRLAAAGTRLSFLLPGTATTPHPGLTVRAPAPPTTSDNDRSLWVTVRFGGLGVVATGDAEVEGVRAALQQGMVDRCDVLVLPHHGRENPAFPKLLAAATPRCCLASNGRGDGRSALGDIAHRAGVAVFATATHGDLVVRGGENGIRVENAYTHIDLARATR